MCIRDRCHHPPGGRRRHDAPSRPANGPPVQRPGGGQRIPPWREKRPGGARGQLSRDWGRPWHPGRRERPGVHSTPPRPLGTKPRGAPPRPPRNRTAGMPQTDWGTSAGRAAMRQRPERARGPPRARPSLRGRPGPRPQGPTAWRRGQRRFCTTQPRQRRGPVWTTQALRGTRKHHTPSGMPVGPPCSAGQPARGALPPGGGQRGRRRGSGPPPQRPSIPAHWSATTVGAGSTLRTT
eukprot:15480145-Alexandrium_andersonii.AAC.1